MDLALRKVPFFHHPVEISLYSAGHWHWSQFFHGSFFPSSGSRPWWWLVGHLSEQQGSPVLMCFLKYFMIDLWHLKMKYMEMASEILFADYYYKT